MRYAVFTDIHANLEALEAVLAQIDEIAAQEPIDQIWFLGDLVGYGPDPNECIVKLRERTDVIIAGNHDWAAVGKIDLEEFSPAARISAEWTAETLTEEHRTFLANLPERLDIGEITLVHGSPYGPLWEYLTREDQALAERSFEYFTSRYCFVGHTHVPVIFQQSDVANAPTIPLGDTGEFEAILDFHTNGAGLHLPDEHANEESETSEMAIVHSPAQQLLAAQSGDDDAASAFMEPGSEPDEEKKAGVQEEAPLPEPHAPEAPLASVEGESNTQDDGSDESTAYSIALENDAHLRAGDAATAQDENASKPLFAEYGEESFEEAKPEAEQLALLDAEHLPPEAHPVDEAHDEPAGDVNSEDARLVATESNDAGEDDETKEFALASANDAADAEQGEQMEQLDFDDYMTSLAEEGDIELPAPGSEAAEAEERLNSEIEELLTLLGLSQSMVPVTNEMLIPLEGHWELPEGYRAIVNPGGVGQPRDGDPRAAFMIYDTERGFEFYRVPYDFEKTQEKIINAGLPQFLAVRLQFGR